MCAVIAMAMLIFAAIFGLRLEQSQSVNVPQVATAEATSVAVVPTESFACQSTTSSDQETSAMLALVGNTFSSKVWTQTLGTGNSKTTSTWVSSSLSALAYLEYLNYPCGVTQAQIDAYYSPNGFKSIFSNYQSYSQTDYCSAGGVELYEFDATANAVDYHVHYWIRKVSPTHVEGLMLVFPKASPAQEAEYAGKLFPTLPSCEPASG